MNKLQYLKIIYILFKKELMSYFNSPIAYVFIGVFLIVGNWLFFNTFFLVGQASVRNYFSFLPWIFLFLAPALTMRLWAEEKKSGTIEFLLTLPITDWQAVLANSPAIFVPIMKFLGLGSHFNNIAKGVLDSKDIIYYLSFIFLFLWLNVRVIERRAWK